MNQNKQGGGGNIILYLFHGWLRMNELMSVKLSGNAEEKNQKTIIPSPTLCKAKGPNINQSVSLFIFFKITKSD